MATLEVRAVTRQFTPSVRALDGTSFTVRDGRIAAILGAQSAGKTALLRIIAGLDRADAGDVLLDDASILALPPRQRGIGMMFDDLALFTNERVRANVSFGLRMFGWPRAEREQRVEMLLAAVGLTAADGRRRIDELSNVERQWVALARMLAPQPSALLLDDPLGTIDEAHRAAMRLQLRNVLAAFGATTLVASADLRDAVAIADDLIVMHAGRVLQAGPVGVVLGEPVSVEVAELAGYITLIQGRVTYNRVEEPGVGVMEVPGSPPLGEAARVMAHPAALLAVPTEAGLQSAVTGEVLRARAIGPVWLVDIALGSRIVEARWEWDLVPPRPGSRLGLVPRPGTLRVFVMAPPAQAEQVPLAPARRTAATAAPPVAREQPAPAATPVAAIERDVPRPARRAAASPAPPVARERPGRAPSPVHAVDDDVPPASAVPPARMGPRSPAASTPAAPAPAVSAAEQASVATPAEPDSAGTPAAPATTTSKPREQRHRGMPLD